MNNITDLITATANNKVILFGEIHGTKEIPEILLEFFTLLASKEDFDLCLEIPKDLEENMGGFFTHKNRGYNDGRSSLEYLRIIKQILVLNNRYKRTIKIHAIDVPSKMHLDKQDFQNQREGILAKQVLEVLTNKKLFIIVGNVHASKKIITIGNKKIYTAGSILYNTLGDRMISLFFQVQSGEYFNFGVRKIQQKYSHPHRDGFDDMFIIPKSSAATFM